MSYCVNCGVKLSHSEKECPLCHTLVINPNEMTNDYHPIYPNRVEMRKKINVKFLTKILIFSFLVVGLICLITDIIISKGKISWSVFCVVSLIYLSGLLQYIVRNNIYAAHIINMLAMEFFILIFALVFKIMNVFVRILLPLTLVLWGYIIIITILVKNKKINNIRKVSFFFFYVVISLFVIELSTHLITYSSLTPTWSIIASIPIMSIAIILFIISFNKRLLDAISQKLFI